MASARAVRRLREHFVFLLLILRRRLRLWLLRLLHSPDEPSSLQLLHSFSFLFFARQDEDALRIATYGSASSTVVPHLLGLDFGEPFGGFSVGCASRRLTMQSGPLRFFMLISRRRPGLPLLFDNYAHSS